MRRYLPILLWVTAQAGTLNLPGTCHAQHLTCRLRFWLAQGGTHMPAAMTRDLGWERSAYNDEGCCGAAMRSPEAVPPAAPAATWARRHVDADCDSWTALRPRRCESRSSDGAELCARARAQAARRAGRERGQWSSRAEAVQKMMDSLHVDDPREASPGLSPGGSPLLRRTDSGGDVTSAYLLSGSVDIAELRPATPPPAAGDRSTTSATRKRCRASSNDGAGSDEAVTVNSVEDTDCGVPHRTDSPTSDLLAAFYPAT